MDSIYAVSRYFRARDGTRKSGEYWVLSRTSRAEGKYCIFFHIISWSGIPLWIFIIFKRAQCALFYHVVAHRLSYDIFPCRNLVAECLSAVSDSLNIVKSIGDNVRDWKWKYETRCGVNKQKIHLAKIKQFIIMPFVQIYS